MKYRVIISRIINKRTSPSNNQYGDSQIRSMLLQFQYTHGLATGFSGQFRQGKLNQDNWWRVLDSMVKVKRSCDLRLALRGTAG